MYVQHLKWINCQRKCYFSVERGADGMTVMYWYHRQFIQAASDRYCQNPTPLHEALADFFSGKWSNGRVSVNILITGFD